MAQHADRATLRFHQLNHGKQRLISAAEGWVTGTPRAAAEPSWKVLCPPQALRPGQHGWRPWATAISTQVRATPSGLGLIHENCSFFPFLRWGNWGSDRWNDLLNNKETADLSVHASSFWPQSQRGLFTIYSLPLYLLSHLTHSKPGNRSLHYPYFLGRETEAQRQGMM